MKTKVCTKCKAEKPFDEFYVRSASSDGRCCECKECTKKRKREFRLRKFMEFMNGKNGRNGKKNNF